MKCGLFDFLFNSKIKWGFLLIAVLLFIAFQADNTPRTDDEYLGEQVYWLLKDGKVRSELGYSELGYDTYQSIYHKLFIYSGFLACCISRWSLQHLHFVSYLYCLCFFVVLYRYTRRAYGPGYHLYFFPVTILLLCNQDLLYAAGSFRPEVMVMLLGFYSYASLHRFFREQKTYLLLLSAIAAGLSMFAHLNGVIFIIAGCFLLLQQRQYKATIIYALTAGLAFVPFFADIIYHADLHYFWQQFNHDPIIASQTKHWYDPFLRLLREQQRFLFTEKQILFTVSLLLAMAFSFKQLKQQHKELLVYTAVLVIALAFLCPSKSTKYMVLYLPFLYLILTHSWYYQEASKAYRKIRLARTLLLAGVLVNIVHSTIKIRENIINLHTGGLTQEHEVLAAKIRAKHNSSNLLVPRLWIFNELGRFRHLLDIDLVAKENLKAFVAASDINYVVFSEKDQAYFNVARLLDEQDRFLEVIDSSQHYLLTKVIK